MELMKLFSTILLVQLFYAMSITLLISTMPVDTEYLTDPFSDVSQRVDLNGTINQVQSGLESQTKLPLIEFGAILFYSGNILIDLLLNFAFAIPQMIGFVVYGITSIFNFPTIIVSTVQAFASGVIILLYFISLIQLLMSIRSGRGIT